MRSVNLTVKSEAFISHSSTRSEREMPSTHKLLEGRRPPHAAAEEGESAEDEGTADESKTRKHISMFLKISNYLTRTRFILLILIVALAVVIIYSLIVHSRDSLSDSSSGHISRMFFGFDGLESDFGSLGVPWCKLIYPSTVVYRYNQETDCNF